MGEYVEKDDLETLEDIYSIIDEMIVEEPPITITEGRSY